VLHIKINNNFSRWET